MNFSSCSDHSWIINDCYIFFPYLQVWVFLFLRTSFFTAQNVGPMIHIDGILIDITTFSQSGPGSYGNEEILHIPQSSRTWASLSGRLESYPGHLLEMERVLPLCRDAIGIFYSPCQKSWYSRIHWLTKTIV